MVVQKKNMLEAFKASAAQPGVPGGRKPEARSSPAPSLSSAPTGIDRSPQVNAQSVRLAPEFPAARRAISLERMLRDPTVRVALIVCAIAVALAYWAGRKSSGPVQAVIAASDAAGEPGLLMRTDAKTASKAPGTTSDPAKANHTTAAIGTPDDQAFMDPENKFTVRVAQYKNDETGEKAARAAVEYLRREGYPAVRPIVPLGGNTLIVAVGHTPKMKDLATLVEYVQDLRGPNPSAKKPPFEGAYIVNIDDLVKRN